MRFIISGGIMEKRESTYFEHYLSTIRERHVKDKEMPTFIRKLKQEEVIRLYDKIKLLDLTNHLILDVILVLDSEANVYEGKYGQSSLFGQQLLGKTILMQFQIDEIEYKILSASGNRT